MRILIFGTGKVARDLLENKRIDVNYIEAFTETVSTKSQWYGKRVIAFEEIQNIDAYDMLIIALMRPDDIYKRCLEKKLNPDKICLLYPLNHNQNFDVDKNLDLLNMIFDENTYEIVCNRFGIIVNDWIAKDELQYIQMNTHESMRVEENFRHYIYKDKYDKAGDTGSYFWQDLWAAKKIIRDHPKQHYDIGSRVDGFIAHLLAAAEQLRTYANILEVPFRIIYTPQEIRTAIEDYAAYDYIFVDTSGHSQKNTDQRDDTLALLRAADGQAEKEVYLVVSATTKYRDLLNIADTYQKLTDFRLVFTKLDETQCQGNLFNLRLHTDAPMSYVTCGQNVPDDIGEFDAQKTVKLLLGGNQFE